MYKMGVGESIGDIKCVMSSLAVAECERPPLQISGKETLITLQRFEINRRNMRCSCTQRELRTYISIGDVTTSVPPPSDKNSCDSVA